MLELKARANTNIKTYMYITIVPLFPSYGRQNNAPKDVRILIPRAREYVMLHGKGRAADGIKVLIL